MQSVFESNSYHQQIFPDVQPDYDRGWSTRGLYFKWLDSTGQHQFVDKDGWSHLPSKDPQYNSVGFNGGIIGARADIIILDDPFDPTEMNSPTWRKAFEERFKTVVMSRLKDEYSRIIFVCNRWHYDDMVPKFEDMGYDIVRFPAIGVSESGDEESFWPDAFPMSRLHRIRNAMGTIDFNCLYQGDPSGSTGLAFKREFFHYYEFDRVHQNIIIKNTEEVIPYQSLRLFQAVDPAASTKNWADYFVIATCGVDRQGRIFVLDIVRKRLQGPDQPGLLQENFDKWKPYGIGIEKVAYQLTLVQYARRLGLPIIELERNRDKLSRHLTLSARYQANSIYHLAGASWLYALETELLQLPKGAHDDQADALADCADALAKRNPVMGEEMLIKLNKSRGRTIFNMFG